LLGNPRNRTDLIAQELSKSTRNIGVRDLVKLQELALALKPHTLRLVVNRAHMSWFDDVAWCHLLPKPFIFFSWLSWQRDYRYGPISYSQCSGTLRHGLDYLCNSSTIWSR
jgi:hypothetical protein